MYDQQTGCQAEICKEIRVGNVDCIAAFGFMVDDKTRTVDFVNKSSGTFTNWYWQWGDGSSSTLKDGKHTYAKPGLYKVCFVGRNDSSNCFAEVCQEIIISDSAAAPICDVKWSHLVSPNTREVKFNESSLTNYSKWYWSFGNGKISDAKAPTLTYLRDGMFKVCLNVFSDSLKCSAERCKEIKIQKDTAIKALSADFSQMVIPDSNYVVLTNKSTGNPTSWYWTFGDGTYGKGKDIGGHKYLKPGSYKICLTVFDAGTGISAEKCATVTVGAKECDVLANFSSFVDINTREVKFTSKAQGYVNRYYWNFGDGATGARQNPAHTYAKAGFYLVSLAVQDTVKGCADYFADFIQVGSANCKANFDYVVDVDNLTVDFTDISNGDPTNHFWMFGDGSYDLSANPSHTFKEAGVYRVSLTITDATGTCSDFVVKKIQVGNVDCSAGFTAMVDSSAKKAWFTKDVLGSVTNNFWVFGDGKTSTHENPEHTYNHAGYYTVALNTFHQQSNCIDRTVETVLIGKEGDDCEADFFYLASGKNVKFKDNSLGDIVQYKWYFGDGDSNKVAANPMHDYAEAGYYNVCLTVYTSKGIANTTCKKIAVSPQGASDCLASFTYAIDSATKQVKFKDESFGEPTNWRWDFGDDNLSTGQNPAHTYADTGYFPVWLLATNNATGCASKHHAIIPVGVKQPAYMRAAIFANDTSNTKGTGKPVDFIGVATGKPAKYSWNFGDGNTADGVNSVTHTYTESGEFTACLTIEDPVTLQSEMVCQLVVVELEGTNVSEISPVVSNYNVWPNPFTEYTNIKYELSETTNLGINVYTEAGARVQTLVSTVKQAGKHEMKWATGNLSPGAYLIEFTDGQQQETITVVKK
ncbi:MAG: PKD domain-containing protein [Bacteroidales bacterium]|nr:PKD domain-containing protein [Bacteroidales bacterium]